MDGRTHTFGGACAGLICADLLLGSNLSLETLAITGAMTSVGALGGIFCDIDTRTSKISKKLPITSFILNFFVKHRGITHTYIPYVIATIVLFFPASILSFILSGITNLINYSILAIYILLALAFLCGVTSHFILDMITTEGVPILYPIYKKKISIARFTEKKNSHKFFIKLCCLIAVFITLYFNHITKDDVITQICLFIKEHITNFIDLLTTKEQLTKQR